MHSVKGRENPHDCIALLNDKKYNKKLKTLLNFLYIHFALLFSVGNSALMKRIRVQIKQLNIHGRNA